MANPYDTIHDLNAYCEGLERRLFAIKAQCAEWERVALMTNLKGQFGIAGCRDANEVAANARLIAAAPDLLDELLCVLDWAVTERAPLRKQEIESIRAAIAKATGEQP